MRMAVSIGNYAMIGNCRTAALVSREGSIDWLCLPRFDSPACFARLLGTDNNGGSTIAPQAGFRRVARRYRGDTFVLETDFENEEGCVRVVDFMPLVPGDDRIRLVRTVAGIQGTVRMRAEFDFKFEYGRVVPRLSRNPHGATAVAAPDAVSVDAPVDMSLRDSSMHADFTVSAGQEIPFMMTWYPAHYSPPRPIDPRSACLETERWWQNWSNRCEARAEWRDAIVRSLLVLKAMTYPSTGAIVAAATTSIPESLGRGRNWDYRYCWIRDAGFAVHALLANGHREEARAWYEWLLRCIAGEPSQIQTLYGLAGERLLPEIELKWLEGYQRTRPVRIGNDASSQFQLDVFGEMMSSLALAQREGLSLPEESRDTQLTLANYVESAWKEPDNGIWEDRGLRRHYTYSKILAWAAIDRAITAIERYGLAGPVQRWRRLRSEIHSDICDRGFSARRNAFVRAYNDEELDAALLRIPSIGFLPSDDPRVTGTVRAIRTHLIRDGLVLRFADHEGAFIPCTLWLAENLAMAGQLAEARELFSRILSLRNDVGLLSEEYSCSWACLSGNFPQTLSHASLVNCAQALAAAGDERSGA
jgi:GH15 family glucan-1,4-alpha-glucosidase